MPKVEFKRVQTDEEVENIDIKDGQLIYTGTGKTYMDYGNERIPTGSGGGSVNVDTEMSDISENAVQNKVIKEYVDDQIDSIPEEVVISDEEPTDPDVKLWIDSDEVGSQVSEITNSYSTSTGIGYSANYINNNVGVVESGSNANGSYIKYADGTMICYQSQLFSGYQITGTQGVLYTTTLTPNDYPVAFVGNLPIVSRSIKNTTWTVYGFGSNNATAPSLTNSGSFEIFRGSSTGTGTVNTTIDIIAIGRWKA